MFFAHWHASNLWPVYMPKVECAYMFKSGAGYMFKWMDSYMDLEEESISSRRCDLGHILG